MYVDPAQVGPHPSSEVLSDGERPKNSSLFGEGYDYDDNDYDDNDYDDENDYQGYNDNEYDENVEGYDDTGYDDTGYDDYDRNSDLDEWLACMAVWLRYYCNQGV